MGGQDKKIIIYALIVLAGILIIAGIVYFNTGSREEIATPPLISKPRGAIPEEVLKNLTAPQTEKSAEVPYEVIKNLTAPASGSKKLPTVPEEVLKNLTAPR